MEPGPHKIYPEGIGMAKRSVGAPATTLGFGDRHKTYPEGIGMAKRRVGAPATTLVSATATKPIPKGLEWQSEGLALRRLPWFRRPPQNLSRRDSGSEQRSKPPFVCRKGPIRLIFSSIAA